MLKTQKYSYSYVLLICVHKLILEYHLFLHDIC